jgi:hypothetical protein
MGNGPTRNELFSARVNMGGGIGAEGASHLVAKMSTSTPTIPRVAFLSRSR